jgi:hypothetical protein
MFAPRSLRSWIAVSLSLLALPAASSAFCGFYVAKADAQLFNRASKVVLVRDGERTVLTMASDYQGEPSEFALVVPVPVVLKREQIHVANPALVKHLDEFTAPRLVEYYDEDPCHSGIEEIIVTANRREEFAAAAPSAQRAKALGVRVEAEYTVGEYDIQILSAQQSDGLATFLRESGYRIPAGAEPVLASYLKHGMRFFVAKVDLGERQRLGVADLRPLQMAFESPKFMLPLRLGTVNANGPQDLLVFALTRGGRVESTNYRTLRIPTDVELPPSVQPRFADFYRDMFARQREQNGAVVFTEHAWDMSWCDPCAAEPLSEAELRELGVFWNRGAARWFWQAPAPSGVVESTFVTRLHVRYDAQSFPEDLSFQVTGDRANFQGRYVMRHPWQGASECEAAARSRRELRVRQEREARTLADLTGWDLTKIRAQAKLPAGDAEPEREEPWWRAIWPGGR